LLALSALSPAFAQESTAVADAADGGDIVVTARHRTESLQNVPIAISAFSETKIEREGIKSVEGVAKLTPGLTFDKGFSPQDNRVTIRGLPSSGRPAVAMLIDGIDYTTESIATGGGGNLMDVRLFDFERIEVVKGPQSALYGRSAFGGAINYIPKDPADTFGGTITGELGTYGRAEIRGAIDLPVEPELSVRINGVYSRYDGFYRNSVTGNRLGGYESAGGSMTVKYEPAGVGKIVARVSYIDDRSEQRAAKYYGLNSGLSTDLPTPAGLAGQQIGTSTIPASIKGYRKGLIANENVPIAFSADPSDPTGKSDYPGAHTKTFFSTVRTEFDLGGVDLGTWTGYVRAVGSTKSDVDYFGRAVTQVALPAPGGLGEFSPTAGNGFWQFDISTRTEQISHEVRFSNQRDGNSFRWALGGLYWWERVRQDDRRVLSYGLGGGASAWLAVAQRGGASNLAGKQGRTTEHYSGYAMAEYDLLPKLTVSAEGRYAKESYNYLFGQAVGLNTLANITAGGPTFVYSGTAGTATASTTYFAPRGILTYKPNSDMMFYASAARGVKPGGLTQVGSADPSLGAYKPERVSNYELGAKLSLANGRVRINGAIFHMDYKDKQAATLIAVPFSVNPQGALSVTTNAGKAKIDGQEIDIWARVTDNLIFSAAYTHLNARYKEYIYNTTSTFDPARTGNCTIITVGTSRTCQINLSGNGIEGAPAHSATGTLSYTREIASGIDGFFEVTGRYQGQRWSDPYNAWKLKDYATFDVRFGVEKPGWSVTGYVNNIFEDKTIRSAISLLDVAGGSFGPLNLIAYVPDPREAGVRVKFDF
jgi:outer membrane receptor protein involved in Fe transport